MTVTHRRNIEYLIKRVFDVGVSILGLAVLSPLLLGISIAIICTSRGPVLYRQQRIGLNGKPFTMLKFRTMTNRADETSAWTVKNDPRRTGIGIWLRRYSLDELPQLFNVLCGSMSLVGPRPEQPVYAKRFEAEIPDYARRFQMRPGITGWAQVNGLRGDTSVEERTAHDLWYVENWSLGLDARILLKTIFGGMVNRQEFSD